MRKSGSFPTKEVGGVTVTLTKEKPCIASPDCVAQEYNYKKKKLTVGLGSQRGDGNAKRREEEAAPQSDGQCGH